MLIHPLSAPRLRMGFTLMEILVVLGIVSVAGAFSIMQWSSFQSSMKLNSAVTTVHQAILEIGNARTNTAKKLVLTSGTVPAVFQLRQSDNNAVLDTYSLEGVSATLSAFNGSGYTSVQDIAFDTEGLPEKSTPFNITFSRESKSQTITLLFTGKVVIGEVQQ